MDAGLIIALIIILCWVVVGWAMWLGPIKK